MAKTRNVFISYARADGQEYSVKLEADLLAAGFMTWRDLRNINEYQDFSVEIEVAIRQADFVVTCITPSVEMSPRSFVRREIIYADANSKPIIPCIFPDAVPITLINHLTWIAFYKTDERNQQVLDYESGLKLLLERLDKPCKYISVRPNPDPYESYLKALYEQTVDYLDQTSITPSDKLIELHVDALFPHSAEQLALPRVFFEHAGIEAQSKTAIPTLITDFNQAFKHYDGRILLLGVPGAGKTTMLLAFVRDAVTRRLEDSTLPLPIVASISTWKNKIGIVDWLTSEIALLKREQLGQLIGEGKALLVFDGLDELGDRPLVPKVGNTYSNRQQFLALLPANNQVVVSCRTEDYRTSSLKAGLKGEVVIQPLSDDQIQVHVSHQPELLSAFRTYPQLREVVRTPLMLALFMYSFTELESITPHLSSLDQGELHDKIFETFVRRRYEHEVRKRALFYSLEKMTAILRLAAYESVVTTELTPIDIPKGDFRRILNTNPDRFLEQVQLLNLLIVLPNGKYRFIHGLLRNYFAFPIALEVIEDSIVSWRTIPTHVIIAACLGLSRTLSSKSLSLNVGYRFLGWLMRQIISIPFEMRLLSRNMGFKFAVVNMNVFALATIGDTRAVEPLIGLAKHAMYSDILDSIVFALGIIGDRKAVKPLITMLNDEDRPLESSTKYCFVLALAFFAEPEAFDSLVRFQHDSSEEIRFMALLGIARINNENTSAILTEALGDSSPLVRELAEVLLEELVKTPNRINELNELFEGYRRRRDI